MTTEARIHANRLNAQKSTGPQTPQGKAVVSQNALKHGLSARHDVITSESQADFDLHRDALLAELHPIGPMESILADRIVSLSWRLKRAALIQNQAFDAMHEKNTSDPLANLAKSFGLKAFAAPQPDPTDPNPDLTLGRIALKDFSNARVLDRLLMYERRIEHSLYKTTLELQRLHLLRTLEHPNATNVAAAAPPFSRRRHDDALTPNSTPRTRPKPSNINHPASSIEHRVSRIRHHCAKQTQFQNPQNKRNPLHTLSFRPKPPRGEAEESAATLSPLSNNRVSPMCRRIIALHCAKQTQFQNGQYEHKYSKNKGLCQRTTNNEQRTLFKTNPIKPNSPTPPLHASRDTTSAIRNRRHEPCTTAAGQP